MRTFILLILATFLYGCAREPKMARVAGQWPGEFHVDSKDVKEVQQNLFRGYLQLYLTGDKFKMEMTSPQQGFTVEGKWHATDNRIQIHGDNFTFHNPSEEDQKTFGMHLVTPDQIRETFGRGLVLEPSEDRKTLAGLKTSFGKLIGSFRFERPLPQ